MRPGTDQTPLHSYSYNVNPETIDTVEGWRPISRQCGREDCPARNAQLKGHTQRTTGSAAKATPLSGAGGPLSGEVDAFNSHKFALKSVPDVRLHLGRGKWEK